MTISKIRERFWIDFPTGHSLDQLNGEQLKQLCERYEAHIAHTENNLKITEESVQPLREALRIANGIIART